MRTKKPRGVIIYNGPSILDGSQIVAIATFETSNRKTGNMIQVWIIPADLDPITAVQINRNRGACGDCPLQGIGNGIGEHIDLRTCYVNLGQAPRAIYDGFRRGIYPAYNGREHKRYFRGASVRLGAYGDPAAIPIKKIRPIVKIAKKHTGYSHQLFALPKRLANQWAKLVMCSCHTPAMYKAALARGWRSFTTIVDQRFASPEQLECPNYTHDISCEQCGLCNGNQSGARDIYVIAHGKPGLNLKHHQLTRK